MSRLLLAFLCFFRILFGKKLPAAAVKFLPEGTTAASSPDMATPARAVEKSVPRHEVAKPAGDSKERPSKEASSREAAAAKDVRAEPDKPRVSTAQHHRDGA